jgi:hypothetical protein
MSTLSTLHPHGDDFDQFLYAPVGEDQSGSVVTVLSALARLGLDPWQEARELSAMSRDAAYVRLGSLLHAFKDVPTLGAEHKVVAAKLTSLLPERLSHRVIKIAGPAVSEASPFPMAWIFAGMLVVYVLAQLFLLAAAV